MIISYLKRMVIVFLFFALPSPECQGTLEAFCLYAMSEY